MQVPHPYDIEKFTEENSGWEHKNNSLVCLFPMPDFLSGLDFVNDIASLAEEEKHHPSILLTYGGVTISLATHEIGSKVTQKDLDMAEAITEIYNS